MIGANGINKRITGNATLTEKTVHDFATFDFKIYFLNNYKLDFSEI